MSRHEEIEYAKARHIPIPSTIDSPYSVDTNLWGRSIERGVLEDSWQESPEDIYALTRSPQDCPDEPAYVEIEFDGGVPVRANGIEMPLVELIESLETIAGAHGVGRIDMVENAAAGVKSREIYEAPAAVLLHTAHSELEKLVVPRDLERLGHDSAARTPTWSTTAAGSRRRAKRSTRSCARFSRASRAPCASSCSRATAASSAVVRRSAADRGFGRERLRPCATPEGATQLMAHLWSGRFAGDPDAELFAFGSSFRFDRRLFEDDVRGQPGVGGGARARRRAVGGGRAAIDAGLRGDPRTQARRIPASSRDASTATRTSTPSSSASWWRASATPAGGCTPAARATSRSPSICGST